MKTITLARTAALAFALTGYAGCADQDSPGASTGTTQEQAEAQALSAVEMVDQIVADSHQLAAGEITGFGLDMIELPHRVRSAAPPAHPRFADSPVWNGDEGAWYYTQTVTDESGTISLSYWVQFLDGSGVPQTEPNDVTDRIRYSVALDMHFAGVDESTGDPMDVDLSYEQELTIAELQAVTWEIGGGGSMNGTLSGRSNGRNYHYVTAMDWNVDVTVPADGSTCASGNVVVNVDDWTLLATYDAAAQIYAWAMYPHGSQDPVATGTGTSACSVLSF